MRNCKEHMYRTIIQVRTNSTRLPAKCMLSVCDKTLIGLCAERAKTNFSKLIVACSQSTADDLLANHLNSMDHSVFRGDEADVLGRFVDIVDLEKLSDDATIIRLTGDNPVVDGEFLERMRLVWEAEQLEYLSGEPEDLETSMWPKGLSAEFFRVSSLRHANTFDKTAYGREHVTPYIKQNCKKKGHMASFHPDLNASNLMLGVDSLRDYLFVAQLFNALGPNACYLAVVELASKMKEKKDAHEKAEEIL